MTIEPGAIVVMLLYALALYVILVVSPRLSPALRVPAPWWHCPSWWPPRRTAPAGGTSR